MKRLTIALVVLGVIAGAYKLVLVMRERRAESARQARVALAEILCESELLGELADVAASFDRGSLRGSQFRNQMNELMGKLDVELEAKGVTREETEAWAEGTAASSAVPLLDKIHEICPDSYKEDPARYEAIVGLVFGYYEARSSGSAP